MDFARAVIDGSPLGSQFKQWAEDNGIVLEGSEWVLWWNCYLAGCQASAQLTRAELRQMTSYSPVEVETF